MSSFDGEFFFPAHTAGTVQTRSEETGLIQHETLEAAIKYAESDDTVWKISYQSEEGWQRIVIR